MRKFLFIAANEWEWGGSEALWSRSAEMLARRGSSVRASVRQFDKPTEELERLSSAGGQIFYRRPSSFVTRLARKTLPLPEYSYNHLRSVGKGMDLVVISQGSIEDGLPWIDAARAAGLKYTIIVQAASEFWWPSDQSIERLAPGFENAVRPYFVSEATLDLCRRQFGTPLRCGQVVRNPFNVRYDALPAWPTGFSEEVSLACVGRLEVATKGQDVLLETLSMPRWRERKLRVSFVGKGPHERGLQRRAQQLGLTNVHFTGHLTDIERVWASHHALVLPSRQEGMPLVVVEAMLSGRPCIATDVGGSRELIRDNVNGFLAKAPTVELIDEAMNRAWENRARLKEIGEIAAADVRRFVSPDPVSEFVHELQAAAESNGSI